MTIPTVTEFSGKRLFLYAPRFHGYEDKIINALLQLGISVDFCENKPQYLDPSAKRGKLIKTIFGRFQYRLNNYLEDCVYPIIEGKSYDILLVINGYSVNGELVKKFKEFNPHIKTILYFWDSHNLFDWSHLSDYFDVVYSFDSLDCEKYNYKHIKNFFIPCATEAIENDIPLFFVGTQTASFDRYSILLKLYNGMKKQNAFPFFRLLICHKHILHSKLLYFFIKNLPIKSVFLRNFILNYELYEKTKGADFIIYQPLDINLVQDCFLRSHVILDLSLPQQSGYSHRLIQALACGKKIMTTNVFITKEAFFNPEQIRVLNPQQLEIDWMWILDKQQFAFNHIVDGCQIDQWLLQILSAVKVPSTSSENEKGPANLPALK
ncbi:MAG: hypothetical protein PHP00_13535 [Thiotrichaceae bacterium]|nr:hypothetical protein [Thiotrichaceae bacterium]